MNFFQSKPPYQPVPHHQEPQEFSSAEDQARGPYSSTWSTGHLAFTALLLFLSSAGGFLAGLAYKSSSSGSESVNVAAPRVPALTITRTFVFGSPFSEEPPRKGDVPEPVWDALIPNGLGYFKDGHLAPAVSIPTVFHQLHCLYVLRRSYYSQSEQLEDFDFGRNRSHHVPHCFDYLEQTITCASDGTVEPAEGDGPDGFLGSGFPRQCRDFETVKDYVERWRVFNATGFLAHGLSHGQARVS
ncbi:hypothetical protein F5Y14DRAFT_450550 [Nemania sp. NC0429]|nr:hypothetical protein F5Y14DRAFT_450550 [Nemania sp. NC0429]